jgi:Tfp pilus assembly protein PilO
MNKLVIGVLAFILAGSLFFVFTKPQLDTVRAMKVQISQYDEALDKFAQLARIRSALQQRYNTVDDEQRRRLTHMMPDHVDNIRLILDIDSIASRYGMAVQNVTVNREDSNKAAAASAIGAIGAQTQAFDSISLQFTSVGTYENFVRFLRDIESSLRVVDVTNLNVQPIGAETESDKAAQNGTNFYKYTITLRTYWLK